MRSPIEKPSSDTLKPKARAAVNVDDQIVAAVRRLLEFPESGRLGRVAGTRELVVSRTPFIAAYVVTADRVRILRVLHGAQVWPDEIVSGVNDA